MIDFIRPPIGPRVDLLRIQAVERITPTKEENYQAIINMQDRQSYASPSTRPLVDQAEFSEEGLKLLAEELAQEQLPSVLPK